MTDPRLTLLLDIDEQVRRDRDQAAAFLHRRDRRFALACHEDGRQPAPRAWLDHLAALSATGTAGPSSGPATDPRLRPWRRLTAAWVLVAAVLGILAMLGLLFYDGSRQINVTVILAFIALQLLLAVVTAVLSLTGWQPWGSLPGRWARHWQGSAEQAPALRQLQPQLAGRTAQLGGLVFALAGWFTLLVLVVVQDLAFGWSTTLDTAAASYHGLVATLATPWQAFWPAAVPGLELVSESRFFRLGDGQGTAAARWGDWWPFVAMAWLVYAVIPRLLLLGLASAHLRWRLGRLLRRHPGLMALQYRMETPAVEVGTGAADTKGQPDLAAGQALAPWPERCNALVRWAGAGQPEQARLLLSGPAAALVNAGGALPLASDQQALARVADALPEGGTVLVLTRAWEPPTAELADLLQDARSAWPEDCAIVLVPVLEDLARRPSQQQMAQWQRFADRYPALRLAVSHPHDRLEPPAAAAARVAGAGNPELPI